jgi:glycosyltransferase involved in cell wall biosynthesis
MRHQVGLVRAADAVVVMTPTEAAFYEQHGVLAERLHIAPPGVDWDEARLGDGQGFRARHGLRGPLVVFLSAMARDKGAMDVVEAVRRLWASGREVELIMAGRVLDAFERYRAALPAADQARLRVLGPLAEAEKDDLLAAADIVAMPSRTDSFGIIYQEAWLHGKPVVGARAWGMSDVIRDGDDGLLVPFGDVPALAEALASLLDDPARRAVMGARGAEKVLATGTWAQRYAVLRGVYQTLVPQST